MKRGQWTGIPSAVELSRRRFIQGASAIGAAGLVAQALPVAERILAADPALAQEPVSDATLQAFADTMIPGRRVDATELGDPVHPQAIAGVDPEPGAVETDALRLFHSPLLGFDALAPAFLADLGARSLERGGTFLSLPYEGRVAAAVSGFSFDNPDRVLYEAAGAIPFVAFCAAGARSERGVTSRTAGGYRVMGFPGEAPIGYPRSFSYRRRLARGITKRGSLP